MQDVYCQAGILSAEVLAVHPQYLLPAQVPINPEIPVYAQGCVQQHADLGGDADQAQPQCAPTYFHKLLLLSMLFPAADAVDCALQYLCTESTEAPLLRTVSSMGNGQDSWAVSQSRTPSAGLDSISDFVPGRLGVQVLFPAAVYAWHQYAQAAWLCVWWGM